MPDRLLYVGKDESNRKFYSYLQKAGFEVCHCAGLRPSLRALSFLLQMGQEKTLGKTPESLSSFRDEK